MSYPKNSSYSTQQERYSNFQQPLPGDGLPYPAYQPAPDAVPPPATLDNTGPINTGLANSNAPYLIPPSRVNKGKKFWALVGCGIFLGVVAITAAHVLARVLPHILKEPNSKRTESTPTYMGCINKLDLDPEAKASETLTTFKCLKFCDDESFKFALTHNGQRCSCANFTKSTYPKKEVDDDMCNTPCSGRVEENCGSPQHESVYRVGPNLTVTIDSFTFTMVPFHLTWSKSRAYCQSVASNGDLATVSDLSKWRKVMDALNTGEKHQVFWIGLSDSASENNWVWNNGNTDDGSIYWNDGEPNSWEGTDEDCAAVMGAADWQAFDVQCNEEFRGVCQYPA